MTEAITSTRNARIVEVAKLHRRRTREATRRYLLEGPNAVREGLAEGVVEELFVTSDLVEEYRDAPVAPTLVAEHVLERLADTRTPQGVVAVAALQAAPLEAVVGRGVLVVLHEVADPGNAGTVVRTVDAAGGAGVVLTPGSVDPHNPKAVRASAGSVTRVPVLTDIPLGEVAASCRGVGQRVVGLDPGASETVFGLEADQAPVALVLGNEAHGLDDAARAFLDAVVAVPLYGGAESLNLAATAAIAVYAAARGRHPGWGTAAAEEA